MTSKHRKFNAENVRMVRTGLRLTQEDFGRLLGVSRRTIIRWERGQHFPAPWKSRRRKFFLLWDKHKEWLNYVNVP